MVKEKGYKHRVLKVSELQHKAFKVLKPSELSMLQDNLAFLEYRKGENIIKQGTYLSSIFFVTDGLAKICIEGSNGKNLIVKICSPGDFIGLIDLFSEKYNHSSVVAVSMIELYFFDAELIRNIAMTNPNFASELLIQQSRSNELWIKKLASLGTKQMHGRLADALLYLSADNFLSQDIFEYLSRSDIAELTGMSKENAIRLLSEFKNDGIISINGKKISINNIKLLERLSLIG
ncbi:MAG: Crp/Fnr family transcriptional regulator [Bacteroidales bacterium]|nr:Crp/Fnr family transcriptional regulator [Bacteroidales bacterium]